MKHTLILYVSICLMFLIILTNITLLNGEHSDVTMILCLAIFIFSSTIFGLSRKEGNEKVNTNND